MTVQEQAALAAEELCEKARLGPGSILVVGWHRFGSRHRGESGGGHFVGAGAEGGLSGGPVL